MTNHDMIAEAVQGYRGEILTTARISEIVLRAYPGFNPGSLLPNDHGSGNKCPCRCVGTKDQIFEGIERGRYRVLSGFDGVRRDSLSSGRERRLSNLASPVKPRSVLVEGPKLQGFELWAEITKRLDNRLGNWRARIQHFNQVPAVQARSNGGRWNDKEIFEGMVLSILSNSTDWSRVEAVRPHLDNLFLGFDLIKYAALQGRDIDNALVPWFNERHAGWGMLLSKSLKQLITSAGKLSDYSGQYGSVENFLTWLFRMNGSDSKLLARVLGDAGDYKLPGFGIPLAAEALKNIGYDVAKPDRHINRAVGCFGMVEFRRWHDRSGWETPPQPTVAELMRVMRAMEELSREVRQSVTFVDNAVWLLCARSGLHMSNDKLAALAAKKEMKG